jgi:hypothetical protein
VEQALARHPGAGRLTPADPARAGDLAAEVRRAGAEDAAGTESAGRVVAVVKDLFFVARIRETARLAGVPLVFARGPEELEQALARPTRFVLLDLTAALDYERVFALLERAGARPLAFTTHALARDTRPWHARCARVVTKETLSQELPILLREGPGT